jgi:hypothetical protein
MFRLLITFSQSFAGGGAVVTSTLVPFNTKEEADEVYYQHRFKASYNILKMYEEE